MMDVSRVSNHCVQRCFGCIHPCSTMNMSMEHHSQLHQRHRPHDAAYLPLMDMGSMQHLSPVHRSLQRRLGTPRVLAQGWQRLTTRSMNTEATQRVRLQSKRTRVHSHHRSHHHHLLQSHPSHLPIMPRLIILVPSRRLLPHPSLLLLPHVHPRHPPPHPHGNVPSPNGSVD